MAIAVIVEVPGGTREQYDRVSEAMGFDGESEASRGMIVHFAGLAGDRLIVVDVWESPEAYGKHLADLGERGRTAVREAGLPPYEHRQFELFKLVK